MMIIIIGGRGREAHLTHRRSSAEDPFRKETHYSHGRKNVESYSALTIEIKMALSSKLCFVAMVLVAVGVISFDQAEAGVGDCYETWSRCSRWSSWGTGRLWLSCNDRCKELGRNGGSCRLTPSSCPLSNKAYQCQCF
ncbi:macin [Plakobranchus ocellatus]|uniref:Macin n=1 Tax=Plakobranchus ocellatus TaxID=259542 RepID=A0AAV4D1N5_9GAST|nr:macin [Plakobranchus ocellatus]